MQERGAAEELVTALEVAVARGVSALGQACAPEGAFDTVTFDRLQPLAYDIATVSSSVAAARALADSIGEDQEVARLALLQAAEVAADLRARVTGRAASWGLEAADLDTIDRLAIPGREPALVEAVAARVLVDGEACDRRLGDELELVRRTFRRFADERVTPVAESVHRQDLDLPESIVAGLAELGCFALSIPEEHGGFATGGPDELMNMVTVTEELSRGSLGVAGSLITRPEIMATAILKGGTDEQRARWLPRIASGEAMCAVAVTEPEAGSDVAALRTSARRDGDEWVLDGVKTWCTFAGRAELLLVLARTDPDRSLGHRGLSLFVVEKPRREGHAFEVTQEGGGRMEARSIPTLGYRGMHSFEVSLEGWRVPADALIGEDAGIGRGFYLQMQAFANARLQTAARALGVMQSALEGAVTYTRSRRVFAQALSDAPLTRATLARMAASLAACRASSHAVARKLAVGDPDAQLAASQVKQVACRAAEWVTREAQQLHGGYGYAEEYTVSRLFVDARVLSIFEGTDEVLALRVIARGLLASQATPDAR